MTSATWPGTSNASTRSNDCTGVLNVGALMARGMAFGRKVTMSTILRVSDINREAEGLVCVNTVSSKIGTLVVSSGARSIVGSNLCAAATVHTREAQQRHHLSSPYKSSLWSSYYASVK